MPTAAPDTLPADFFSKQQPTTASATGQVSTKGHAPDTLPADFFSTPQSKQTQSEDSMLGAAKGFASNLWDQVNPAGAIHAIAHPIDSVSNLWKASTPYSNDIIPSVKRGDYSDTFKDVVGALPFGPGLVHAGEALGNAAAGTYDPNTNSFHVNKGQMGSALGEAVGQAVQPLAPEALGEATKFAVPYLGKAIQAAPGAARATAAAAKALPETVLDTLSNTRGMAPEDLAVKALRGSSPSGRLNFKSQLGDIAIPEVAKTARDQGIVVGQGDDALNHLIGEDGGAGLVKDTKDRLYGQFQNHLNSAKNVNANIGDVGNAIRGTITDTMRAEDPAKAAAIGQLADIYKGDMSVQDIAKRLRESNAQLSSYYDKNPAAKRSTEATNPDIAAEVAKRDALSKVLNDTIDSNSGVSGEAKEALRRYGAVKDFENALNKRKVISERQAPASLYSNVGNLGAAAEGAQAAGKLFSGDLHGALMDAGTAYASHKIGSMLQDLQSTNGMLKTAFSRYENGRGKVYPDAYNFKGPNPVQIKGLLGPATQGPITGPGANPVVTPPPAGSVPQSGPLPQQYPIGSGVNRLLPAPGQTQVPNGFQVTDAVPVKDPSTGKITYHPAWSLQNGNTAGLYSEGKPVREFVPNQKTTPNRSSSPLKVFTYEHPDGTVSVISGHPDSPGATKFDPTKPGGDDVYELSPDRITDRAGGEQWKSDFKKAGLNPNNVSGYATFSPGKDGKTMYPGMVYVSPELRRQGIASTMYDAAKSKFEPQGYKLGSGAQRPQGKAFRKSYDDTRTVLQRLSNKRDNQ